MGDYHRPGTLGAALTILAAGVAAGRPPTIVAGATDHYPARVGRQPDEDVLDVSGLPGARAVEVVDGGWRIPAATTWTAIAEAPRAPLLDGLRAAARTIGGRQIQNRGTLVGNLCNASPAADGLPNLLVLDAVVELASVRGVRRIPAGEFVTGNRATVRAPDELVTGLWVPDPGHGARSTRSVFRKLGSRAYLVISIVSVAGCVTIGEDGRVAATRLAVGACSPVPRRLLDLEEALVGRRAAPGLGAVASAGHLAGLTPIDDVRGSAEYRREAALVLVRRALEDLIA